MEVNFPEDYHGKDVAGKTAVFTITLSNVSASRSAWKWTSNLPKPWALPMAMWPKCYEVSKKTRRVKLRRRTAEQTKEAVMEASPKATKIQLPKALVAEEAARPAAETEDKISSTKAWPTLPTLDLPADRRLNEQAERRVALGFLIRPSS